MSRDMMELFVCCVSQVVPSLFYSIRLFVFFSCHCRNSFLFFSIYGRAGKGEKLLLATHPVLYSSSPIFSIDTINGRTALLAFRCSGRNTKLFFAPSSVLSVCCIDCYCRHKTSRHSVLLLSIFLLSPALLSFLFGVSLFQVFFLIPLSNSFFFAAPI
jgi:hypothetical protein